MSSNDELTRRDFVAMTVAGIAVAAGADVSAQNVTEKTVEIKTPDGTCDAAFIYPATGAHAAVIIWPDAFGLRPSMRNMAKRLASESGYSVLVPNPFYRVAKAPVFEDASNFNFGDTTQRAKLTPLMGSINAAGAAERDAAAFVTWLDAQPQVDRTKKIGTQGYCMGGALVVRTAAAVPNRIGAGASFHGGGLVTPNADSPHLLAPKINPLMASINAAGTVEKDAPAFVAWLDQQPQVDRTKKIGTQGYCMGGALVVRTAAAVPDRIGAGGSFHGGGLVNQTPTSPHLLAPKIKGRMYFGIATNDDMQQPDAKTALKAAFDAAKVPVEVEVYSMAQHGWCVPDMPNNLYKMDDAERAWTKLLALYKAALS